MPRYKAHHPDKRQCKSFSVQPSITGGPYALPPEDEPRRWWPKPDQLEPGDRGTRTCCGSHILSENEQLHIGDILRLNNTVVKIAAIVAWSELPNEVVIELADGTETIPEIALMAKLCYDMSLTVGATD